jgi:hypothetical protein
MKKLFYDSYGKVSFGRIMGFTSMILGVVLFIIAISFNWYQIKIQQELFDLVKWMFGQGATLYGVSKGLDTLGGK